MSHPNHWKTMRGLSKFSDTSYRSPPEGGSCITQWVQRGAWHLDLPEEGSGGEGGAGKLTCAR